MGKTWTFEIKFIKRDDGMDVLPFDAAGIKKMAEFSGGCDFSEKMIEYVLNYLEILGYMMVSFQKNDTGVSITITHRRS